jgi:hypothetical protein
LNKIEILLKKKGKNKTKTKTVNSLKMMATSAVKQILVGQPSKMKIKILKKKPVVVLITPPPSLIEDAPEKAPAKSIWLQMRRAPRMKLDPPLVWEQVEDISDDENDTPQAAEKRLSHMKKTRDHMQRRAYEEELQEYQHAGLFLNWSKAKKIQVHPEQNTPFVYTPTVAYPY